MHIVSIPTVNVSESEGASATDESKSLVEGETAISDVFHQLLASIQALQLEVSDAAAEAEGEAPDVEGEVDADEAAVDTDGEIPVVNIDVPKGLLTALEKVKAAIEAQKELVTLPQQAKSGEGQSKLTEPLTARVAMQKLNELLLGYQQAAEGDADAEDGAPLTQKKVSPLTELIKASATNGEAVKLQVDSAVELPKSVPTKPEAPPLAPTTAPSGEGIAAKGSGQASETPVPTRPQEPPTIRTVGDFTVRSVRHLLGSEQESIQIRMVPRSLGELHIAVTTVRDAIEITVTAASGLVRDVLESQLAGLRDVLARDGVEVSKITVHNSSLADLGSQLAQSQSQAAQRQAQQGHVGSQALTAEESDAALLDSDGAGERQRGVSHDGDLDMRA